MKATRNRNNTQFPIILLHGAWYTPKCWDKLKIELDHIGLTSYTPAFPYYDQYTKKEITRSDFIDDIVHPLILKARSDHGGRKPILLGHSLAGTIIAETAERYPDELSAIVFLAAFMLTNDMAIRDIRKYRNQAKIHEIGAVIHAGEAVLAGGRKVNVAVLDQETAMERFCQDCSKSDQQRLLRDMKWKMPSKPIKDKVKLGENYERVPRFYIKTLKDQAVSLEEQTAMLEATPDTTVFNIETGHSPFMNEPGTLADILKKISLKVDHSKEPSLILRILRSLQNLAGRGLSTKINSTDIRRRKPSASTGNLQHILHTQSRSKV